MCKTIKITGEDKFVWRILTFEQALLFIEQDIDSVYELRDGDSESLISDVDELCELNDKGAQFGIEVGFLDYKEALALEKAIADHDFTYECSDDPYVYRNGCITMAKIVELKQFVSNDTFIRLWNNKAPKQLKFKSKI